MGFKIGPRINAAGRLASANTAIDLFAAVDDDAAWALCAELDRMNIERQQIEVQVREAAEAQVMGGERILILAGEGWHRGVLGLTAGRIAQRYHRPTLVMTIEGDLCVGSGRSITTINLHEQLDAVRELFTHFGGHEFACGFSLETRNLPELRARLHERFAAIEEQRFSREAHVDATLTLSDVDGDFLAAHEMLQPFGAGNPQPLFLVKDVQITGTRTFAEDCCELSLQDATGRAVGVLWPSAKQLAVILRREDAEVAARARVQAGGSFAVSAAQDDRRLLDLLVKIEPDRYHAARLEVIDARVSASA